MNRPLRAPRVALDQDSIGRRDRDEAPRLDRPLGAISAERPGRRHGDEPARLPRRRRLRQGRRRVARSPRESDARERDGAEHERDDHENRRSPEGAPAGLLRGPFDLHPSQLGGARHLARRALMIRVAPVEERHRPLDLGERGVAVVPLRRRRLHDGLRHVRLDSRTLSESGRRATPLAPQACRWCRCRTRP